MSEHSLDIPFNWPNDYNRKGKTMRTWNEILSDPVLQEENPSIKALETYLNTYPEVTERSPEWQKSPKESVKLKLAAMQKQSTTIEATMSRTQLIRQGNPLWARDLTPNQIGRIIPLYEMAVQKVREDIFFKHLETLTLRNLTWKEIAEIEEEMGYMVI